MWPPTLAIAAGLAGGLVLVGWSRRGARRGQADPVVDLLARKDALYAQVRELDDTRDRHEPALYQQERERLLAEAAGVLRQIDGAQARAAGSAGPRAGGDGATSPASPPTPPWVSAGAGGAVVALVFGLYKMVTDEAAPRAEGQGITGGQAAMGGSEGAEAEAPELPPAVAAELVALAAAVEKDPADLEAKNRYGHALIAVDRVRDAWKLADAVTEADPGNAEARTHQAVVLIDIGDTTMAASVLDRVLVEHPAFTEALGYRGAIYAQQGDKAGAVDAWTRARASDPAGAAVFDQLLARVDSMVVGAATGDAAGGTADEPVPVTGAAELSGEVRLAAGTTAPSGTLFVYVRPEGQDKGPPARVKRLGAAFPAAFSIAASDSPMGGTLSGRVWVSAKLDQDGNPSTTEPGNLAGRSEAVEVGATGIVIELR